MRKSSLLICAFVAAAVFGLHTASAQFPKIPKIPKTDRSKPQPSPDSAAQPSSGTGSTSQPSRPAAASPASAASTTAGEDQPTINKNSIVVDLSRDYRGSDDTYGWLPSLSFRVNGPVASGSQLYAEFSLPTGGAWVKFDCKTRAVEKGAWLDTECGGRDIHDAKPVTYTGVVNFSIKLRNELAGTPDVTLFNGRAKVGKAATNDAPKNAYYYVDQDWRLPIGGVFLSPNINQVYGMNAPKVAVVFWVRGELSGTAYEPHLFSQGREIGGTGTCSEGKVTTSYAKGYTWSRIVCDFNSVLAWNKTGEKLAMSAPYMLDEHPGDYEFKFLWNGHLARAIKFSVDSSGNIVDTGLARANRLGTSYVILPVQVLGGEEVNWDRNAWRTDAYYGNPLTGFSPPQ